MARYIRFVLIAADQLANALLGGYADETLSSRIHRGAVLAAKPRRRWLIARRVVNGLFWWQADHCAGAYKMERHRGHLPDSLKN
ncbi:hypothetical protein [Neisseria sp. S1]|uniref:hypothetical protein n=1 Tax=Neisseria sp. S1 TaxID=3318354 RepID=UPI003A8898D3